MARNGTHLSVTRYLTYLAEAQVLEGAVAEALATVEEALQANPEELLYRPETLRLRGELRFSQGHAELAEADFREAIALAQQMSAKGWELRAAMSLGRILAKHGRRDEARSTLLEIYGWFTEGFDTSDLKDAKALLDELGG
jgi:predicted ATPase